MTTGRTIALTRWTFVCEVMILLFFFFLILLFNMLYRLVIAFLPRSKHLLISCLQSSFAVILEPPEIKSLSLSIVSPSIYHEVMIWIYLMWIYLPSAIRETPKNESESHSVLSDSLQPHGLVLQAWILEWVVFPFSSRYSQPRNWIWVSCYGSGFFTNWPTWTAY